jgi:rhomboid family protein
MDASGNKSHSPPPYVTYYLIVLNLLCYIWEIILSPDLSKVAHLLGFVPVRIINLFHGQATFSQAVFPLFTSLFLHGSSLHLLPNLCFLFIFGRKVEESLGHGRFLFFYLAGGVGADLVYLAFAPFSSVPLIGSSGAIAAVMAAYFSLFPGLKFSILFIVVWVLLQFFYAFSAAVYRVIGQGGMAWWAHVGGFFLGLLLIRLLAPDQVRLRFRSGPKGRPDSQA